MKNKFLLLALLCTLLLSVGSVCAADANINVENLSNTDVSVVGDDLNSNDNDDVDGSNSTNGDVISSFSDIQKLIDETENNTIYLNNTTYYGNGSLIVVNKSITIDGNGATLDGLHKSRIFNINANNVVLTNLNLINGGGYNNNSILPYDYVGGAIYWVGNGGKLINSTVSNNYAYNHGAITWSGSNGTIINTDFKNNVGVVDVLNDITGPGPRFHCPHSFINGLINGFYDGDLMGDSYLKNVSVNSNPILSVNSSVVYDDYLLVSLVDDNGLPYFNDSLKVRIYNSSYECYLEAVIDDRGVAKIKLPFNLSTGKYNITYYLKKIISYHWESPNVPVYPIPPSQDQVLYYTEHSSSDKSYLVDSFTDRRICYDYKDYWIKNSSLSVLKSNASLNSSNLDCVYNSNNYFTAKLVDSKGNVIGNSSVLFKVYTGNGKYKSYSVKTDSNGVATLKHNFKPGKYVVKIESINPNYDVKSVNLTLKVSKAPVIIKAPKVTKKYHKKAYFKINIMNKATKKVIKGLKIRIKVFTGKKYKTYSVKTNSKGVASLSTKSFEKGKHKVIITSNNNCYSISKKGNLIVIK